MIRFVRHTLVSLCSLLVVMPMGWCCWLFPAPQASAKTPQIVPCRSCCTPQPKKSAPTQPKETPRRSPCGCDQRAGLAQLAEDTNAPLPALPIFVEVEPIHVFTATWSKE